MSKVGMLLLGCLSTASAADAPNVVTLPQPTPPHYIWVNDFVFPHMVSGKAMLVDGDAGRFVGEMDTGFGSMRVVPSLDGRVIYSPETYFSRGTRGERTDVISLYDPAHLSFISEIQFLFLCLFFLFLMANAQ